MANVLERYGRSSSGSTGGLGARVPGAFFFCLGRLAGFFGLAAFCLSLTFPASPALSLRDAERR
jgi:hypothetical protein